MKVTNLRERPDKPDVIVKTSDNVQFGIHSPILSIRWKLYRENQNIAIQSVSKIKAVDFQEALEYIYCGLIPKDSTLNAFNDIGLHLSSGDQLESFRNDMLTLYTKHPKSDFKIICKDVEFPVHRFILAASSLYFYSLFQSELLEEQLSEYTDYYAISAKVMGDLLLYIYTGSCEFNSLNDSIEFLKLSNTYRIKQKRDFELEKFVARVIVNKFSTEIEKALTYAHHNNFEELHRLLKATEQC